MGEEIKSMLSGRLCSLALFVVLSVLAIVLSGCCCNKSMDNLGEAVARQSHRMRPRIRDSDENLRVSIGVRGLFYPDDKDPQKLWATLDVSGRHTLLKPGVTVEKIQVYGHSGLLTRAELYVPDNKLFEITPPDEITPTPEAWSRVAASPWSGVPEYSLLARYTYKVGGAEQHLEQLSLFDDIIQSIPPFEAQITRRLSGDRGPGGHGGRREDAHNISVTHIHGTFDGAQHLALYDILGLTNGAQDISHIQILAAPGTVGADDPSLQLLYDHDEIVGADKHWPEHMISGRFTGASTYTLVVRVLDSTQNPYTQVYFYPNVVPGASNDVQPW
jgi:hypothetical protein